jgi:hypothetical protein
MLQPSNQTASGSTALKTWILMHVFRIWTALVTLVAFGLGFLYRPEWLTWWLRMTTAGIERTSGLLPYPWGDRLEVALRGIGGSFWIQITLAILIVRIVAWLLAHAWRRRRPLLTSTKPPVDRIGTLLEIGDKAKVKGSEMTLEDLLKRRHET